MHSAHVLVLAALWALAARAVPVDWPLECGAAPQTVVDARGAAALAPLWQKYDSEPRFDLNSTTFRNDFDLAPCGGTSDALCMRTPVNESSFPRGQFTAIMLPLQTAVDVFDIVVGAQVRLAYTVVLETTNEFQQNYAPIGLGLRHYVLMGATHAWPYVSGAALLYGPGVPEEIFYLDVVRPVLVALPFSRHGDAPRDCRSNQLWREECDDRYAEPPARGNNERLHVDVTFVVTAPGRVAVSRASVESDAAGTIFADERFPNATSDSSIDGDAQPYIALVAWLSSLRLENMRVRVFAPDCPPTPAPTGTPRPESTSQTVPAPTLATSTRSATTDSMLTRPTSGTTASNTAVRERVELTNGAPAADSTLAWLPYAFGVAVVCCALLACVLLRARIGRTRTWYALYYNTPGALRPCVCFACRCSDSWDADASDEEASVLSVPTYIGSPPATPEPFVPPPQPQKARESYSNRSNNEYSVLPIYQNERQAAGNNVYDAVDDEQMRIAPVQYDQFLVPKDDDDDDDGNYVRCTGTFME